MYNTLFLLASSKLRSLPMLSGCYSELKIRRTKLSLFLCFYWCCSSIWFTRTFLSSSAAVLFAVDELYYSKPRSLTSKLIQLSALRKTDINFYQNRKESSPFLCSDVRCWNRINIAYSIFYTCYFKSIWQFLFGSKWWIAADENIIIDFCSL